jgi:hypothetical protein
VGAAAARGGRQGQDALHARAAALPGHASSAAPPPPPKSPEASAAFQAPGGEPRQRAVPPEHRRPGRVFSPEDSRLGLWTARRRRLTARGARPVGPVPPICGWCDVYGAVAPTTGERFCSARPSLDAETFQRCLDALAQAVPDRWPILRLDHRGAPTARHLIGPEPVRCVGVPPYGPARQPRARLRRDLTDPRAWTRGPPLETLPDAVGDLRRADEASTLPSLTGYPSRVEAIHARCL